MKLSQRSGASLSWPQPGLHSGLTRRGKFTKALDSGLTWILLHLWPFPIARNFALHCPTPTYFKHGLLLPEIMSNMCIVIMFPGSCIVGKGVITPPPSFPHYSSSTSPISRFPPFEKSKMSPPFIGLPGKQKYWMTLLTDLYIISTHKVS